jgi:hypothetical protein
LFYSDYQLFAKLTESSLVDKFRAKKSPEALSDGTFSHFWAFKARLLN